MSSALVGYSSGEEEDTRAKGGKRDEKKANSQSDVNYDDVQMEMSDDEGSSSSSSSSSEDEKSKIKKSGKNKQIDPERELFSTEADYKSYKNQFSKTDHAKNKKSSPTNEYGGIKSSSKSTSESSEYGSQTKNDNASQPKNDRLKRLREMSKDEPSNHLVEDRNVDQKKKPDLPPQQQQQPSKIDKERRNPNDQNPDDRKKKRDKSRSKSPKGDRKKHDRPRGHHERGHHHHKRGRSRSRSRDRHSGRDRHSRPPHRSRSSSRERRQKDQNRDKFQDHGRDRHGGGDRQELRNRKLYAMGLTEPTPSKGYHSGSNPMPTQAALAAAVMANTLTGDEQDRAIKAQLEHVKAVTGVDLPKYYNPAAINPLKFAEQIKKRQMLWGAKKAEESAPKPEQLPVVKKAPVQPQQQIQQGPSQPGSYNKWEATNFGNSQANEKFRRLMGIKGADAPEVAQAPPVDSKQIFGKLEQEYERARTITHTQRGLGLGFSSTGAPIAPRHDPTTPIAPATTGINFVKK